MNCRQCGANGADSSGRCYDCVEREWRRLEMEMRDIRSLWKIRDIEEHRRREAERGRRTSRDSAGA